MCTTIDRYRYPPQHEVIDAVKLFDNDCKTVMIALENVANNPDFLEDSVVCPDNRICQWFQERGFQVQKGRILVDDPCVCLTSTFHQLWGCLLISPRQIDFFQHREHTIRETIVKLEEFVMGVLQTQSNKGYMMITLDTDQLLIACGLSGKVGLLHRLTIWMHRIGLACCCEGEFPIRKIHISWLEPIGLSSSYYRNAIDHHLKKGITECPFVTLVNQTLLTTRTFPQDKVYVPIRTKEFYPHLKMYFSKRGYSCRLLSSSRNEEENATFEKNEEENTLDKIQILLVPPDVPPESDS
jgi:hypothetical protein